jgi:hypothetical protein
MPKHKHDPNTAMAFVVRYAKADPGKHKVIEKVKGQKAAIDLVEKLTKDEKQPEKFNYLWRWANPRAALEADLEQIIRERSG